MLGGFNMDKALINRIGKFIKINGFFDTLIESDIFGVKQLRKLQVVPTM